MPIYTFTLSFSDINFELIALLQHDVVGAASEALTHLRGTQAALLSGRGLQARGGRARCAWMAQGRAGAHEAAAHQPSTAPCVYLNKRTPFPHLDVSHSAPPDQAALEGLYK